MKQGNRAPQIPESALGLFDKLSKADWAEIAYDYYLQITGDEDWWDVSGFSEHVKKHHIIIRNYHAMWAKEGGQKP